MQPKTTACKSKNGLLIRHSTYLPEHGGQTAVLMAKAKMSLCAQGLKVCTATIAYIPAEGLSLYRTFNLTPLNVI